MKYITNLLVVSVCALSAVQVQAADFFGKIREVRPTGWAGGGIVILMESGTLSGTSPCNYPDGTSNYFFIPKTDPLHELYFTVALSAQFAERSMTIVGDGTCGGVAPWLMEGVDQTRVLD